MAATKHTKAFYNTEIPSDWEIVKVLDFGKVYTGNTPLTSESENYDGSYLFVSPGDLSEAKYIDKTEKTLTEKGFATSRKFPKGSVLFTCIGSTIGKSGIATVDLTANQQINAIVVNSMNSNEYLYYQLEMNVNRIKLIAGEQAVPIINKSQFESIKLPKAPLPEQKAIARVLSTADAAIHTTEKLIAQKELRKKWLMQQLLMGKKRLKGFGGEWKKLGAGEVFKSVTKKGFADEELLSATQDRGMIPRTMLEGRVTMPTTGTEGFKLVEVGDFVISLRSFQGGLEYSYYRGLVSPAYTVLKPKKPINEEFYIQYFKSYDFIGHLAIAVIGIRDGKQISYDDFCTVKIPYPTIEEQTAIARVLQAADKEISLLKAKAEKLREQKKGLMQVLLTGKVRLKTNEKLCS
jgi:type I restriction enzyme, S subunit